MSRVAFFKFWKGLEKSGALRPTPRIGRATMFRLERENEVVRQLVRLDTTLSRKAVEKAAEEYQRPMTVKPRAR